MENLINNIPENLFFSIGWTILHSIWIGAIVSILLFIFLIAGKRWKASVRYNISYAGMLLFFSACTLVFIKTLIATAGPNYSGLSYELSSIALSSEGSNNVTGSISGDFIISAGLIENIIKFFNRHYYILACSYIAGLLILTIRFTGGAIYTRRLKKSAGIIRNKELNMMLKALKLKLGIKKGVRLAESAFTRIPAVIGSIKPYILIPVGSLTGIPSEQLETILLHELAHIKRNDFLLNLIQSFIEIVMFYHPAIWWISSTIRNEREYCCDNIVLSHSEGKLHYIKALLRLSENKETLAVNAVAITGSENRILERIKIMVNMKRKGLNRMDKLTSALMSVIVIAGIILITAFREPSGPDPIISEIPESESSILHPDGPPMLVKQINSKQDTIRISGKVHRDYLDPADNREKEVTLNFKDGELTELIIDGKTIPQSEYYKYNDLVNETREDLADARADMADAIEDIEESLEELEEIDIKEMQSEIQEAMKEMEELDIDEMLEDIEESLQGIEEIDLEDINADIDKALIEVKEFEFDMQDMMQDWEEMKEELTNIDLQDIEEEIAMAMEEIKNIDKGELRREFERSMKRMEDIDYKKIKKEMEESMMKIEESLKDLEIDYRKSAEEYRKEVKKHKKEYTKQMKENKLKEKENK